MKKSVRIVILTRERF